MTLAQTVLKASVTLPAGVAGSSMFQGTFDTLPAVANQCECPVPVVVFMHGSSGLNDKIRAQQGWLTGALGVATIAPDSFAVAGRPTYTSPAPLDVYERVHALRQAEIRHLLEVLASQRWADRTRMLLAGTSEGAVAAARWPGGEFAGRIIYAWSCEDNYFVDGARNGFGPKDAVLNIISADDPFFSPQSPLNQGVAVAGHGAAAVCGNPNAQVVLIPGAPHTLFDLPAARALTAEFVRSVLA